MSEPLRAMWLMNHKAARKFEIPMMKRAGIAEIFASKSYPNDPFFRSADTDWSEDAHLTIPAAELQVLNETQWYGAPSREAWEIANRRFDVLISNFVTA